MKKLIITAVVCYLLFELLLYFSIAFSNMKINPGYWSYTAREGYAFVSIFAFIVALLILGVLGSEKNRKA